MKSRAGSARVCAAVQALQFLTMTAEAKHLIQDFQSLPDAAKREVLAELVRISRFIDYPEMSEEELVSAANDVFAGYDEREKVQ